MGQMLVWTESEAVKVWMRGLFVLCGRDLADASQRRLVMCFGCLSLPSFGNISRNQATRRDRSDDLRVRKQNRAFGLFQILQKIAYLRFFESRAQSAQDP